MNILVISHAHPDFSVGGAEIAAYNLFKALSDADQTGQVSFLARTDSLTLAPGSITQRRKNEFLWRQDMGSWFSLRTAYPEAMMKAFGQFLGVCTPHVVFIHHYAHIGIEMLRAIRRFAPDAFVVLTLHEYLAICNRNGQMIKARNNRLCYRESLDDCSRCFPEISEEDFWLRKSYILRHFSYVDHFVSPSSFLKDRYVAWGIPADKLSVIENGQPTANDSSSRDRFRSSVRKETFGFFGQVTEYKGLDIFLKAVSQIPESMRQQAAFEVHGANLDQQGDWLKELVRRLSDPLIEEGTLRWAGAYSREEALSRISRVDWVVVPSIWWENSPMIIQEAFVCGKPVICSNIGGMAEKVVDRVSGIHFEVGNSSDLAEKLTYLIENTELRSKLTANIRMPISYAAAAQEYLSLVQRQLRSRPISSPMPSAEQL